MVEVCPDARHVESTRSEVERLLHVVVTRSHPPNTKYLIGSYSKTANTPIKHLIMSAVLVRVEPPEFEILRADVRRVDLVSHLSGSS